MRSSWVAFVISLFASIFCAVVWLNNVYLSWVLQIWKQEGEGSSAIVGLDPLLDVFCVDHSTVSTFIPFFSLVCLALAFLRAGLWAGADKTVILKKEFPFFSGYNEWIVALGLMGTVWGLIMIGYLPNPDNMKITDLIEALHTALFSTLVALIWVYIFVLRIIRPFMHWYLAKLPNVSIGPKIDGSLEETIEKLADNLKKLNDVLVDNTRIIEGFKKKITIEKLKEVEASLKAFTKILPFIETSCKQQPDQLEKIKESVRAQLTESTRHTGYLKKLTDHQAVQVDTLSSIKDLLNQQNERDAHNRKVFGKIINVFKGYTNEE